MPSDIRVMLTAVEFDDKHCFNTQEVEDVPAKGSLPPEFQSQLVAPQQ